MMIHYTFPNHLVYLLVDVYDSDGNPRFAIQNKSAGIPMPLHERTFTKVTDLKMHPLE